MWGRLKAGFAGWVRVAPACVASVKREAKLMSRARFPKTETYSCRRIDRTRLLLTGDRKLARPRVEQLIAQDCNLWTFSKAFVSTKKKLAWKDNLQRHKLVAPSVPKYMHLSFVTSRTFLSLTLFNEKNIKFMT